ncbi:hypothetical protein JK635_07345 [Neobacillus sp. YIM B02564]|uniref:Uncharacterized protein n=1 Tax=Neobacillus paridis TaxID=2803862 RepID=A0ABS1TLF4_9BACI|nr:hypothetical protein [Neobacillus paridis]MBL4952023.1 hypothetical protein [Neobacillus paridis]
MLKVTVEEDSEKVGEFEGEFILFAGENGNLGICHISGAVSMERLVRVSTSILNGAVHSLKQKIVPHIAKEQGVTDAEGIKKLEEKIKEYFFQLITEEIKN